MQTLYVASRNAHKVDEFRMLLDRLRVNIAPLPDGFEDSPEDGCSFEANAMEKAVYYGQRCNGLVLADDSGLCVHALNGRPGVLSARYAGVHGDDAANNAKLLAELAPVPDPQRTAEFVCSLALWNPSLKQGIVVRGTVAGTVTHEPRGDNGFGYDPLFCVPALGRTYAELTSFEKSHHSHRARAVQALIACLEGQADEIVRRQ